MLCKSGLCPHFSVHALTWPTFLGDMQVELGDGVVALPKAPPSRRSALKTTGASIEPDEWAGIATNYEQVDIQGQEMSAHVV